MGYLLIVSSNYHKGLNKLNYFDKVCSFVFEIVRNNSKNLGKDCEFEAYKCLIIRIHLVSLANFIRDADDSYNDLTTNDVIVIKRNLPFVIPVTTYYVPITVNLSIIFKITNGKITTDI